MLYSIHMLVEGYIYAAGIPNSSIEWLIIGCYYIKNETLKKRKLLNHEVS